MTAVVSWLFFRISACESRVIRRVSVECLIVSVGQQCSSVFRAVVGAAITVVTRLADKADGAGRTDRVGQAD